MAGRGPEVGFYCDGCDRYSTWTPPFESGDDACSHCGRANPPKEAARGIPAEAGADRKSVV